MKAILKTTPERGATVVDDYPDPVIADPDDVIIEVAAVSVCGTDREMYEWSPAAQAFPVKLPVVLGHEFAGTVVEVGPEVTAVQVGDRVACETHVPCGACFLCRTGEGHNCLRMRLVAMQMDGAFAEKVLMPERVCFKLPPELSWDTGALLEPTGVAWHAIQRSNYAPAASTVVVTGCGPIGLIIQEFCRYLGAIEVLATDPNPFRRAMAAERGAKAFASTDELTAYVSERFSERGGVDVGFEASGAPGTLELLFEVLRREGQIVTIGHPSKMATLDVAKYINKKGIRLSGVFGRRIWDTWEEMSAVLASGRVTLDWIISHRMPLGELGGVIELLASDANKVIIYPH